MYQGLVSRVIWVVVIKRQQLLEQSMISFLILISEAAAFVGPFRTPVVWTSYGTMPPLPCIVAIQSNTTNQLLTASAAKIYCRRGEPEKINKQ
jgi:hypothetical protein